METFAMYCAMFVALMFAAAFLVAMYRLEQEKKRSHAKCTALVAYYVGNGFAAEVLRAASVDYDSPLGRSEMEQIKRDVTARRNAGDWPDFAPSIPSIWLSQRGLAIKALSEPDA